MRSGFLVVAGTIVTAAAIAATPAVWAANSPVLKLPYTIKKGTAVIPVLVDGVELKCILDTGMPSGLFLFDPAMGKRLGLTYVVTAVVSGTGEGSKTGGVAMGTHFKIGALAFTDQRAIVLTERHEFADIGVDGVIGESVFSRYVVEIDPEHRTVSFYDSASFVPPTGPALRLEDVTGKPFVAARVGIDDRAPVPVRLVVDTGASGTLSIRSGSTQGLEPPKQTFVSLVSSGIAGDTRGSRGRVSTLHLGEQVLEQVIADFPAQAQAPAATDRHGTIGMGVLARFKCTFDYGRQRLHLTPLPASREPFEANMAGLSLRELGETKLRIHDLVTPSPATERGLRVGDLVVALDGKPVATYDPIEIDRMFRRDGAKVVLTIEREGARFDSSLKLRRPI